MRTRSEALRRILQPESVAVVGASADPSKWGSIILSNLLAGGFPGTVHPVNPRGGDVLGLPAFRSVRDLPAVPDLAVVAVPPRALPDVVAQCAALGIPGALVVTAGLAETGPEGERMEREVVTAARQGGLVLLGPNSNGLLTPAARFSCALARLQPEPGHFAILSQSGNIAQTLTVAVSTRGFGVSHYVSSGNEADCTLVDYLEYFEQDEKTRVVLAYVEGFRDGRRLFEVARRLSRTKPVVLLKAGVTEAGARAAQSHTAVLTSSDAVVDAVCKQTGMVRVHTLEDLVDVGIALATQPLPRGDRVGILTSAGGYGVLTADACVRAGLQVAALGEPTLRLLDEHLPARWPRGNPVDKSGKIGAGTDAAMVEILLGSADVDGLIVLGVPIGTPGAGLEVRLREFAEFQRAAKQLGDRHRKPVLTVPTWSLLRPEAADGLSGVARATRFGTFGTLTGVATSFAALVRYGSRPARAVM